MSKQKSQTFVFGAFILVLSNILVKVIGAVFKIPLKNMIGNNGMAYFNAAYSIYVSFYMISTAGIPVAISRMIAQSNMRGNMKEVKKIFTIAYRLFFVVGLVGTAVMIIFAKGFAGASNMPGSYLAMIAIAPTLFFICLSSAYRGYFQGMQNMVPSGISQIIEAVGKLGIGLVAAWYFLKIRGLDDTYVAAFAISGVTIGVLAATIYIYVVKLVHNNSSEYKMLEAKGKDMPVRSSKAILKELIVTALPIALASSIMGLTNTVDTFLMARQLQTVGILESAAEAFYGAYTSIVIPLFNMAPSALIYPFAISVIPALSKAISANDKKDCAEQMKSAFRMIAIISIPCAVGIGAMSRQIIAFLYRTESIDCGIYQTTDLDITAPALTVVATAIFFLGIISITNSILQCYRLEKQTIVSTTAGILVKILLTYFLTEIPNFGIMGSAIGTAGCYFTIMCFNIFFVIKHTGFVPNIMKIFVKPLIAGICCGITATISYGLLDGRFLSPKLLTILSIGLGGLVYLVVLLLIRGINSADVKMLPKGEKICRIMDKYKLLDK